MVNGQMVPLAEATVPVTDPGFTHGWSVFETLDAGPGRDPTANLARLSGSADAAGIVLPDTGLLRAEIDEVTARVGGHVWVRVTVTGSGLRIVSAQSVDQARYHRAVRCATGEHVDRGFLSGEVKHRSRGEWMSEVARKGVDEVLFADDEGRFTEGTSCAVLAVVDGALWTAEWDGRILSSTTCRRLLAHADRLNIDVVRQGALAAGPFEALYVASTTRSIAPVVRLDDRDLIAWDPVGRRLAQADDGALGRA